MLIFEFSQVVAPATSQDHFRQPGRIGQAARRAKGAPLAEQAAVSVAIAGRRGGGSVWWEQVSAA